MGIYKKYNGNTGKLSPKEKAAVLKWNKKTSKLSKKKKKKLNKSLNPKIRSYTLYALRCSNNKYYIGVTSRRNIQVRFNEHVVGSGSQWTKLHKPIEILETIPLGHITESEACKKENVLTSYYISEYGCESVRGGKWCIVDSKKHEKSVSSKSFERYVMKWHELSLPVRETIDVLD